MPALENLQQAVEQAVSNTGQRVSIGASPTFGGLSVPTLFPAIVEQTDAANISFSSVDVSASANAAVVAAGAAKPVAASVAVTARSIPKISAMANLNMESYWQSETVVARVLNTLFASCAVEQDRIAVAALATAGGAAVPATSWLAAIAAGQAEVAGAGGSPNLIVLPAASWADVALEVAGSAGLTTPSDESIVSVLGSRIVLSPQGVTAHVVDPSACVTATRDLGFLVDALSGADVNAVRVVADVVAATFVGSPTLVASIAGPTTPLAASKRK